MPTTPSPLVLELSGVRKSYPIPGEGSGAGARRAEVLHIASYSLGAGEQAALEGPSGSGKTTLLNLIAGLASPDAGVIRVDGDDMARLAESGRDRLRARALGFVFQTYNLLQGASALENVALGMRWTGGGVDLARARALLERVGLGHRLDYPPAALSAGQQQRVALARALANRPRLVLADEPTGALDAASGRVALELLRELCTETGAALLLVSHDPQVLGAFARRDSLPALQAATAVGAGATR